MKCYLLTDIGKVRSRNEDAGLADPCGLYLVADGMGGHQAGEVASKLAARTIQRMLMGQEASVQGLMEAIRAANLAVYEAAQTHPEWAGMGTTLTLLWFSTDQLLIAQVGDSRAYLLRDGELRQCTQDHTVVAELLRIRRITLEQARRHPQRNMITRALGIREDITPDIFEWSREAGDIWLLCSDGLSGMVSDEQISAILTSQPLETATQQLIDVALQNGGRDNVTVLTLLDQEGVS